MTMHLKPYQDAALSRLEAFLGRARLEGPDKAFARLTADSEPVPAYRPLEGLEDVPYACIRLPTGGGKTLLAAHAVRLAADYVERDFPLVLWLAPSTTIADQTLAALKDTRHPYRQALDEAFSGRVRVLDVGERRLIRPQDLADGVLIVVGTMQAFRVSDTGDRNVYADDEAFEPHFKAIPETAPNLERNTEGARKGMIKLSFANLLHWWRPVLILDEAHNFVTGLSGDVKRRLNPACVIEFTATPQRKSNTIYAASARALQAAEMIKLPIMLTEHQSWEAAVSGALGERARLAEAAAKDGGAYVRPITLFKAQPDSGDDPITPARLKVHLIENENIPAERIAVATGNVRDLDGINLLDPACTIEHVITVAALREGWDCSFAYVLCSLANLRSDTAVEQLLGRVLRQPYAQRRNTEALNRAYAHVSSRGFADTAAQLRDKLINLGFDGPADARAAIVETPPMPLEGGRVHVEPEPLTFVMETPADWDALPVAAKRAVKVEALAEGGQRVTVAADADADAARIIAELIRKAAKSDADKAKAARVVDWQEQMDMRRTSAMRGIPFAPVPRLMAMVQGELELVERETLLDLAGWRLEDVPAELPGFAWDETARVYRFHLEGEDLVYSTDSGVLDFALDAAAGWTPAGLSRWLDREIEHADITQPVFLEWLRRLVAGLIARGLSLPTLVRGRYALRRAIDDKVRLERTARAKAGTGMLFDMGAAVVLPQHGFSFDPNVNPAAKLYEGAWRPARHFYPVMGHMNGEELECAKTIDAMAGVKHWVRNGDRDRRYAFWLPTATDAFYPDFVAEMEDGRVLVMEYKGANLIDNSDTLEKDNIGRRWAEASKGLCRFVTVCKATGRPPLAQQIAAVLA